MRLRTFLGILIALTVVGALLVLNDQNDTLLDQKFVFWSGVEMKVGWALVVFALSGMLFTFLIGASRELGRFVEQARQRRANRRMERIEEEYSKGLVAVLEGREEASLAHFHAVLEQDSRHFNTLLKLGDVLRGLDRHGEAVEYHQKAHHLKEEDTRPLYALVDDYQAKGDYPQARNVLAKLLAINKNSVPSWRKLRSLHMSQGQWVDARDAQTKIETLETRSLEDVQTGVGIEFEIANQAFVEGDTSRAIRGLKKLLKRDPSFTPAYVKLGEAFAAAGQEAEALQAWYSGFDSTSSPIFLTVLEEHYLRLEQPFAAIEAIKRCVAAAERDTLPRIYLGKLYFRLEMLDDAMSELSKLSSRAEHTPSLHFLLGRIHERREQFAEAAREYRRVIREADWSQIEYACGKCALSTLGWQPRCERCGAWNRIEVKFREEQTPEELGLAAAPVYSQAPSE